MKRADLIKKLDDTPASELALLSGISLKRGRPSNALRQALIDEILDAISEKRLYVSRDGDVRRKV